MKSKQCVAGAIAVNLPAGMGAELSSDICYDRLEHDLLNLNQIALGYLELAISVGEPGEGLLRVDESLLGKSITAIRDSSVLIDSFRKLRKAKAEEAHQMPDEELESS
ncbi:hypothetical protein [Methanocella arvoryzae]|uniref:hypothetical protein n=1 Tax=Methanocella arvoryzae TaxID=1175445 RepID=UPI0011D25605|nr:hypothetical protein [Methanocella arvoryzae]